MSCIFAQAFPYPAGNSIVDKGKDEWIRKQLKMKLRRLPSLEEFIKVLSFEVVKDTIKNR